MVKTYPIGYASHAETPRRGEKHSSSLFTLSATPREAHWIDVFHIRKLK